MSGPQPFSIDIPDAVLEDLQERLKSTRYAADFANGDWAYGVEGNYLRELVDYWINEYDWRATEREMNTFHHYKTEVPFEGDTVPVHFIREEGKGPDPIPLIISHGWPWSFWDFKELIRPLADPAAYGGNPADAFTVIATSLPGFGFSTPLTTPGINANKVAEIWHTLMTEQLGFKKFAALGGDWGAQTTAQLGHQFPDSLYGIHVSLLPKLGMWNTDRPWDITRGIAVPDDMPADQKAAMLDIWRRIAAHVAVHVLDPQTLAYALNDSPVGLLAWILERRRAWSGCHGDIESVFSKDEILDLIMVYWVTQSIGTSMRIYAEAGNVRWEPSHDREPRVEAPTGVSYFAHDVVKRNPAVEAEYNIHFTREHAEGGHFSMPEQPERMVEDVRDMFRDLR